MSPRSLAPDDSLAALGQAVRSLRIERQLSQEQLAVQAGVDPTYVSYIESGRRNLTWTALRRISAALGVPAYELVRLAEELERL